MSSNRRHSIVPRAAAAAAVGVITTFVLAWLAMFLPWRTHWNGPPTLVELGVAEAPSRQRTFQVTDGRDGWHHVVSYWWMQVSGMSLIMPLDDRHRRHFDVRSLPGHLRPASLDDIVMQSWFHETGWPLPALSCAVHWQRQVSNADVVYRVEGGIQLPRDAQFNPRALPLKLVWPGCVADAALYSAAWWLALTGIARVRRWRRVRRHRCPGCGYPRNGLAAGAACPECGEAAAHKTQVRSAESSGRSAAARGWLPAG